jgi:prevent-host-death family protein
MKLSSQIKPISYLKAHAAEIIRNMGVQREPLVITQNGEAKVVLLDIESYEQTLETMALLKILALGNQKIEAGKVESAASVINRLRNKEEDR